MRKRSELSAKDFLAVISFWQQHGPTFAELGHRFQISRVLAQGIISDYKKKPEFLLKKRARE